MKILDRLTIPLLLTGLCLAFLPFAGHAQQILIPGMEPLNDAVLAKIESAASRLAAASRTDRRVEPTLLLVLAQSDTGLVKRAIAARALARMGRAKAVDAILAADQAPNAPVAVPAIGRILTVLSTPPLARR
jgi:hypothetical protein